MKPKFIDSDKEYIQALYELNLLDDDDDWELYKQQERNHIENDIDVDTYLKYVKVSLWWAWHRIDWVTSIEMDSPAM